MTEQAQTQQFRPSVDLTADPVEAFTFGKSELRVFLSDDGTEYQVFLSRKASGKQPLLVSHSKLVVTSALKRNKDGSVAKKQPKGYGDVIDTRTPEQAIAKAKNGARAELKKWSKRRSWKSSEAYKAIEARSQGEAKLAV